MAQYLPLFTKKIKDPKAIKNQRATKDLDYTRNKEQLAELQQQALQAEQSLALAKAQLEAVQRHSEKLEQNLQEEPSGSQQPVSPPPFAIHKTGKGKINENGDRVIRDPSPRIVKKDQYDEEQARKIPYPTEEDLTPLNQMAKLNKRSETENFLEKLNPSHMPVLDNPSFPPKAGQGSPSPIKPVKLSQSKLQEIYNQFGTVDRENYLLRVAIEEKKQELEILNYKHSKALSRFIEIMRELSRFRDEFNDQYSIRSKMIKVKQVTESIEELLNIKEFRLQNEEQSLIKFQQTESKLFESTSPTPAKRTLATTVSRAGTSLLVKQIMKIGEQFHERSILREGQGTRAIQISGVLCFAQVKIDKAKAECTMTLSSKVYHEPLTYTFKKITERFEPWKEIKRLRFSTDLDGKVILECAKAIQEKQLLDQPVGHPIPPNYENLYEGAENQIVKYIHGAPIRMFTLNLQVVHCITSTNKKTFQVAVNNKEFNKAICTVEVPEERIFRDILPQQLEGGRNLEDEIACLIYKRDTLQRLISRFIKSTLQIVVVGVDISEQQMLTGASLHQRNAYEQSSSIGPFGCIGIVDRDVRGLKFRHTEFPGLRVPTAALALNQNLSMTLSPQKGQVQFSKQKGKSTGGSAVHRNMLAQQNEKMKNAVIEHLGKKKDFATLHDHSGGQTGQIMSNATPVQSSNKFQKMADESGKKQKQQSPSQAAAQKQTANDNKMVQIMKLIHANSMFMHIHSELFFHDKDDFPCYLELVHNTDDDSLLLFLVDDPRDCHVLEIQLADITDNENWLIILQRYARNAEQILCNVETIFRSREFLQIVKTLVHKSRTDRQYQSLGLHNANPEMKSSASGMFNFRVHVGGA